MAHMHGAITPGKLKDSTMGTILGLCTARPTGERSIRLTRKSLLTGKIHEMELPISIEQLSEYANSDILLQNAFPDLPKGQREFIKTGVTPEEWEAHFNSDEEEDE